MQISLDYYRILGVPVQAESHLIEQAYEDRIQQLPHHSYTEYAIASRKDLVIKAYQVLINEQSRHEYESSFFHNQQETSTGEVFREVSIAIENNLFIGALIILLDLGEYELVLRLAKPYLKDKKLAEQLTEDKEEFSQLWQDLVLTVVLAHLELAREEWHDHEYDSAANSLQESDQLLTEEELFTSIRKEIKQDLGKLRPYQVLELFTKHQNDPKLRSKGLKLLQEMFDTRGGIENQEIDESGLDVDGFLRFIQQIRGYLTAKEQQELFEQEAQRPSPAASYLAASACIARGLTERKPELIVQAKNYLISLTLQQDVHLEQSICSLLLGQTTEAEFSLTHSKEQDVIDYIKEISEDSPDLLPGLCLYAEKWLQTEIFPQFKDLRSRTASLQEYFADTFVQRYLESLSPPLNTENEDLSSDIELANLEMDNPQSLLSGNSEIEISENVSTETTSETEADNDDEHLPSLMINTENLEEQNLTGFEDFLTPDISNDNENTYSYSDAATSELSNTPPKDSSIPPLSQETENEIDKTVPDNSWKRGDKTILSILIALISLITLSFIASKLWSKFRGNNEQLEIYLSQPIIELPSPPKTVPPQNQTNNNIEGKLNKNTALKIINQWLNAKKEATGPKYNLTKLNQILTEPQLSLWIANGKTLRAKNAYRRYEHQVEILSAEVNPQNTNQGIVKALVKEKSQYYLNGALRSNLSYDDNLVVDYSVVKEGNQWFIKGVKVVKSN